MQFVHSKLHDSCHTKDCLFESMAEVVQPWQC